MKRLVDLGLNIVTLALLLVAGFSISRPGTPLRSSLESWWRRLTEPKRIESLWPQLIKADSRLDNGTAAVRLIEFADFQCAYCRRSHGALAAFVDKHPNVGVVYRHLPLSIHPAARGAAIAAICAEAQGAFKRLHDYFFETTEWELDTNWVAAARAVHVPNVQEFTRCLHDTYTMDRLNSDLRLAQLLEIQGTPTFVSDRETAPGMRSDSALLRLTGLLRN